MSDIDTRVINAILRLPEHKCYSFLNSGLSKKLFISRKDEYAYLRRFIAKNGKPPSRALFKRKFSDFTFIRVKDPLPELVEELVRRYQHNTVAQLVSDIDPDTLMDDLPDILSKMRKATLESASVESAASDHEYSSDFAARFQTYQDRKDNLSLATFTTGVEEMDKYLDGGFVAPQLVVVAGDPKMGKTWLTIKMLTANYEKGKVVLYISPEMGHRDIEFRSDAMRFQLPYDKLRMGQLTKKQESRWRARAQKDNTPLFITDATADYEFTPEKIIAKIELYKPDLVIVDSAYYLKADGVDQRRPESYLDRQRLVQQLKAICKDKNVPIVCIVQMGADSEKNKMKDESALRGIYGGDHWSQGADVLLRLTGKRSDSYRRLVLLANREGATFKECIVKYDFDPHPCIESVENVPVDEDAEAMVEVEI